MGDACRTNGNDRNTYNIPGRKPKKKVQFGRSGHLQDNDAEVKLKEIWRESVD